MAEGRTDTTRTVTGVVYLGAIFVVTFWLASIVLAQWASAVLQEVSSLEELGQRLRDAEALSTTAALFSNLAIITMLIMIVILAYGLATLDSERRNNTPRYGRLEEHIDRSSVEVPITEKEYAEGLRWSEEE